MFLPLGKRRVLKVDPLLLIVGPYPLTGLEAVTYRHSKIHDYQLVLLSLCFLDGTVAVLCGVDFKVGRKFISEFV